MIPVKLIPIDNPSSNPELNSPNGVVSLPQKKIYDKYNTFPSIIINIPVFPLFIFVPHLQITICTLVKTIISFIFKIKKVKRTK